MRAECQVIYALTSAGGRGFLTRPGCRQSQPEHRLAMLPAPPPPPEPAAPAAAGGAGAAPPRKVQLRAGTCLPGERRNPRAPRLRRTRHTETSSREGRVLSDELSKQNTSQCTRLKITLGRRMPATAWEAQGSGGSVGL